MFDSHSDMELMAELATAQRAERVAVAWRVLATGAVCQQRMIGLDEDERDQWCIDNWAATAAEIGAHLGKSREWASMQMNYGLELLQRLPRLAKIFAAGDLEWRVVRAAVFRTGLVTEPELIARLDEMLTRRARYFNTLSRARLAAAIDRCVAEVDPAALRVPRKREENRYIEFGEANAGMVAFWGSMRATDAATLERRLDELAAQASDDSGTAEQRRADALAALAAGGVPGKSAPIVVTVLAEAAALEGNSERPGYLSGYGPIPPAMLREMADSATLRPLTPVALLCAEPRYRPSRALVEYVRCRDLHCRFPGCDKPAEMCDIDHCVAYDDGGPTHPSNLALLCRSHHLLKTFWNDGNGWRERQFPDGTIEWTAPSGQTYITTPGGAELFPQLRTPTGEITVDIRGPRALACRTLRMPIRQRTRAADRAARIAWERGLNEARWAADPPPF